MVRKCVILAGGRGTRISEESHLRPKPMVEIGGRPILWHIMKIYAAHGIEEFVVLLGYKSWVIKDYFLNYGAWRADITVDLAQNSVHVHQDRAEPWRVTLVETGDATQTGGRLLRARRYLEDEDSFCLTYGDGVGDVDIGAEIAFHRQQGRVGTMTVVQPPGRFGAATLEGTRVTGFVEKPSGGGHINGGFFVFTPGVFEVLEGDHEPLEDGPLRRLVDRNDLTAWPHDGFWQPMDTLRDRNVLETLWAENRAPWRIWREEGA